jgi:hypothetical protein
MKIGLIIAALFINCSSFAASSQLSSFDTDYCTNYAEGTAEKPDLWKHCCLIHDMYFWAGGNKQDRYDSDLELRTCIEKTGAIKQARLMYYAVRAGSYSPIKYPKRKWNNGWSERPGFYSLSVEDIKLIESEIQNGYEFITPEIKTYFINQLRSRLE